AGQDRLEACAPTVAATAFAAVVAQPFRAAVIGATVFILTSDLDLGVLRALRGGALVVFAQAPAATTNWAQFRGNPHLTGVTTAPLPEALKLKWTYDAGDAIESSAAVVDGSVYVGSAKGELLAI